MFHDSILNNLLYANPEASLTEIESACESARIWSFIKSLPNDKKEQSLGKSNKGMSAAGFQAQIENDPTIVSDLIKRSQTSIEELKQNIRTKSGSDLIDFISFK